MIPARARSASFASPELGNAAATSGSRTTTALPAAYRDANLLRDARLKSYSGRISSASGLVLTSPLLSDLFIVPSFAAGCPSRADNANRSATFNIHDGKQTAALRKAQQRKPLLPSGMTRISHDAAQWIAEDCRCLLERDFVFGEICRSFLRVPLKLQRQPSLYSRL